MTQFFNGCIIGVNRNLKYVIIHRANIKMINPVSSSNTINWEIGIS